MMARILIGFLLLFGIATLILVNRPDLVVRGLFMLVLPGVLMAALPQIFLALLGFSVIWFVVRRFCRPLAAIPLSVAGASLGFYVAGMVAAADGREAYARAAVPDVIPPARLTLDGDVFLLVPEGQLAAPPRAAVDDYRRRLRDYEARAPEREAKAKRAAAEAQARCAQADCVVNVVRAREPVPVIEYRPLLQCGAVCGALLATPGVDSVTVDSDRDADRLPASVSTHATRFRLLPAAQCSDDRYQPLPNITYASDVELAGGPYSPLRRCIAADPATERPDGTAIAILRYRQPAGKSKAADPWSFEAAPVTIDRLLVVDRRSRTVLRHSRVVAKTIRIPLTIGYSGRFGWSREKRSTQAKSDTRSPGALLAQSTNLAVAPATGRE